MLPSSSEATSAIATLDSVGISAGGKYPVRAIASYNAAATTSVTVARNAERVPRVIAVTSSFPSA